MKAAHGHGSKFERKKERAIAALLTADTAAEAAQLCGISEATLWRWQQNPEFAEMYRKAKKHLMESATTKLRQKMGSAVKVLATVADDPQTPAGARVSASRAIIELGQRAHETEDLAERLTALEEATERKQ